MRKKKNLLYKLICIFILLLSAISYVSFSSDINVEEVVIKSITPVYDENSTIEITKDNGVIFNDKNQVVDYKVVIENTQDYDVEVTDIKLSTPTEEFLSFEVEELEDNVLKANSTKEIVVSFETMRIKGWGRNFNDELTANITFEKVEKQEEVTPPTEEEDEEETPKEDIPDTENESGSTNQEEESTEEDLTVQEDTENKKDEAIENPYTSDNKLLVVLIIATGVTGLGIILVTKNKFARYTVLIITLSSTLTIAKAEDVIELPIKINVSYESQNVMKKAYETKDKMVAGLPIIYTVYYDFWEHNNNILNIYVNDEIKEINDYSFKYDVSDKQNEKVIAYLVKNSTNDSYYDLYLQAEGIIYLNEDSSYYFAEMKNVGKINNIELLDMSKVTNMYRMFFQTGYDAEYFNIDLSDFNLSNVTNMNEMFKNAGYNSSEFSVSLNNVNASSVTNMQYMFKSAGYNASSFSLDLENFDARSVENLADFLEEACHQSEICVLNLDNFNISNATRTSDMFREFGYNAQTLTIDLTNLKFNKLTSMNGMFAYTGYNSENLIINLNGLDTSNVTDMGSLFQYVGYNGSVVELYISELDTSNVTNMGNMFENTCKKCNKFTLDVSNFDTSNVTNMSMMFYNAGYSDKNFNLDISKWDTSNVVSVYYMFASTGFSSEIFSINLSDLDFSSVTNISGFLNSTGYNSIKLNTSVTIKNPNVSNYTWMFNNVATIDGSQIIVNYTKDTEELVDQMIATKSANSNVVKGVQVD